MRSAKAKSLSRPARDRRAELLRREQSAIIELIARNQSLDLCLLEICNAVARLDHHTRACVLLADESRRSVPRAVAGQADLRGFADGIQGTSINDLCIGTCGEAIFKGEIVECRDIQNDEKWSQPWRELCLRHGIRAGRSTPIMSTASPDHPSVPLGSLFFCFAKPRGATAWEIQLARLGAQLAAIAIERGRAVEMLRRETADAKLLRELSAEMAVEQDARGLYAKLIDAAVRIMGSDFASMQMFVPGRGEKGELLLLAQRGFTAQAVEHWKWVRADSGSTCGEAFRTGRRQAVMDIEQCGFITDQDLASHRQMGMRAVQTTPLKSRSGVLIGMISTHWKEPHEPTERDWRMLDVLARHASDLIERSKAKQDLCDSEERLRLAVELAGVGFWDVDPVHDVLIWPARVKAMFGISPDVPVSMADFYAGLHPEDRPRISAAYADAADPGKRSFYDVEYRVIGKEDGVTRWVAAKGRGIFDSSGACVRLIGIAMDITDRKQAEQAMDQARRAAEDANRAKDKFLAMLSHELRTPLTPVMLSIAAMDADPDPPPIPRDEIAMIRRNIELEARLIDDLLDLSRATAGKLRLDRQAIAWNQALREACRTCESEIRGKEIRLHCDLSDDCGFVDADPARLQQIFWNLLRNAAKFTPAGGEIFVTSGRDGQAVRARVRDTGIGIAPDILPGIFDAFEQGHAETTRKFGGLGLGLAITRSIAEAHGGTLRAQSPGPGAGATFTVEFPAGAPPEPGRPRAPAAGKTGADGAVRVLLAEDHVDTARVLARLLVQSGYHVKTAHSAADALELAAGEAFDVLVSDIGLPDDSGYELMKRIRAHRPMKGIAMSGYGMEEDRRRSLEAGFDDHIVKPANAAQLERAIRRLVGE